MGTDHKHQVATYRQAEEAIRAHDVVYLNDCFCRAPAKKGEAAWEYCGHPVETCMGFHPRKPDWPEYAYREISRAEALALFESWKAKNLLFRFMEDEEWICLCCVCGCGWFRDKEGNRVQDTCDKSPFIERTDHDACNLCGDCVEVCVYGSRSIAGDEMKVDADLCYGCSACEHACHEDAISMVARA